MNEISLVGECFAGCTVSNGIVQFSKQLSKDELMIVYNRFSTDLLDYNIPHWRVIGFYHGWDDVHQHSLFRQNDIYGMSLIELGMLMSNIIPVENGGINPEKGCFYGVDEEVVNNKEFDEGHGRSPSMRASTRHANALKLPKEEIGSLMCDYEGPPDSDRVPYLGTDTIWYTQNSYVEPASYPEMLLPHVKICDLKREGAGVATTFMFIKKGTGYWDYADTQALFDEGYDNIMPCRTIYDLSKFFACAVPVVGLNGLRLVYKTEINEHALEMILHDYGKGLV
jgi:hypothetical protein